MKYTLGKAEKATGKRKSTILNALKGGRLSGIKNDKGEWEIDPAELHRVYPAVSLNVDDEPSTERGETPENTNETGALQAEVKQLHERVSDKDKTIDDLRRRLDQSEDERRRTADQLTGLLTHDRKEQQPKAANKEGFRLFGWKISR